MVEFSDQSNSLKIVFEMMTGNDAIFEVHALMYVVLSKADTYVPYGEIVSTRECMTL
jgi:hypothetical protein